LTPDSIPAFGGALVYRRLVLLLAALGVSLSCRIEDHTPAGSRRDDAMVRDLVAGFFQARGARDWTRILSLCSPAAELEAGLTPKQYVVQLQGLPGGGPPVERVLRTDVRQAGDLASAWVTARPDSGRVEAYYLLLRRTGGFWRIRYLASTVVPGEGDP
jgi:hypothetical protein